MEIPNKTEGYPEGVAEYLLRIFNEVVEAPVDPVLTAQFEDAFDTIVSKEGR